MLKINTLFFVTIACFVGALSSCSADTKRLHDINGHNLPWSELRGKWVFINYWASWCEPCMTEIPELNRFYAGSKHNKIALFAVNYDGLSISEQQKLIAQYHIKYPSLKKDPKLMLRLEDIRGLPATFVFNPKGELSNVLYGGQSVSSLKEAMSIS